MDTGLKPRTIPLLISNSYAFPNNKETPLNKTNLIQVGDPNDFYQIRQVELATLTKITTIRTLFKTSYLMPT